VSLRELKDSGSDADDVISWASDFGEAGSVRRFNCDMVELCELHESWLDVLEGS